MHRSVSNLQALLVVIDLENKTFPHSFLRCRRCGVLFARLRYRRRLFEFVCPTDKDVGCECVRAKFDGVRGEYSVKIIHRLL